jgi:N-acetylglucosamine malate deacetylase 1
VFEFLDSFSNETRVLGIFAHPDDETLCAGGTLARLAKLGSEVTVLCLSDGAQGRDQVFAEAMDMLHIEGRMLRYPTNRFQLDGELVTTIDDALDSNSPHIVLTHWPGQLQSQDHLAVYGAVTRAAARGSLPRILLTCDPHVPDPHFTPNVYVDISDHMELKLDVAAVYSGVCDRQYLSAHAITTRALWWAEHARGSEIRYAEAFRLEVWR